MRSLGAKSFSVDFPPICGLRPGSVRSGSAETEHGGELAGFYLYRVPAERWFIGAEYSDSFQNMNQDLGPISSCQGAFALPDAMVVIVPGRNVSHSAHRERARLSDVLHSCRISDALEAVKAIIGSCAQSPGSAGSGAWGQSGIVTLSGVLKRGFDRPLKSRYKWLRIQRSGQ